jgi:hypothetical protein
MMEQLNYSGCLIGSVTNVGKICIFKKNFRISGFKIFYSLNSKDKRLNNFGFGNGIFL